MLVLKILFLSLSANSVISTSFSYLPSNILEIFESFKSTAEFVLDSSAGNTKCAQDLKSFIADLVYQKLWALQMLDASGKFNSGILAGNIFHLGNFDQCMDIYENRSGQIIEGQYCTIALVPKSNRTKEFPFLFDTGSMVEMIGLKNKHTVKDLIEYFKIAYGVCLPQSCSMQILQTIWNFADLVVLNSPINIIFDDGFCYNKEKVTADPIDFFAYTFFIVSIIIAALVTLYDLFLSDQGRKDNPILIFSVYSNAKRLLYVDPNKTESLKCLNGIKALSMFWVIQGHRFLINIFSANINSFYVLKWKDHAENIWIGAAPFAVESFFVMSGILVIYTKLRLSDTRKIGVPAFYVYRLIRLLPVLVAVMLFYISIAKHLGDGPAWPFLIMKLSKVCQKTWWLTLFQISNWIPMYMQCIDQCWYLSVDTQLYFISPLIIFNIKNHPRLVIISTISACAISAISTFGISYANNHSSLLFDINSAFLSNIYNPTFIRMPPFLIGLICGYVIYQTKRKFEISKCVNIFLWILSLGSLFGIVASHYFLIIHDNILWNSLFNAFAKQIWALAVCWVIFGCVTGNGGLIDKFLSLPLFQILGRLSYCMFLTHVVIILILKGSQKSPGYFSNIKSIHDFYGDLVFTISASLVLSLLYESPSLALLKYFESQDLKRFEGLNDKETNTEDNYNVRYIINSYIFWAFPTARNRGNNIKME